VIKDEIRDIRISVICSFGISIKDEEMDLPLTLYKCPCTTCILLVSQKNV
jgi:hypothetical protein